VKQSKKRVKGSLFYLFLKLVQINYVFCDNVSILYIKEEKHKCCGEKNIRINNIYMIMLAVASNVRIYFWVKSYKNAMKAWSTLSNIAHLVCILFSFSCYCISKYIITCILIIIDAILMSKIVFHINSWVNGPTVYMWCLK
jgi:hypothetical protein